MQATQYALECGRKHQNWPLFPKLWTDQSKICMSMSRDNQKYKKKAYQGWDKDIGGTLN